MSEISFMLDIWEMNMRKKRIIGFVGLILVLLIIVIVLPNRGQTEKGQTAGADTLGIPIEVLCVESENIQQAMNYMGTVKSKNQAALAFKMSGIMREILVAAGDDFVEGQILAELSMEDLAARYGVIQQKVASAKINADYLKNQSDKNKMLYDEGAISHQQFLDINYRYEMAVVGYHEALALAREIEVSMNSGRIYAPYDGTVRELLKQEGEMIQPGQTVFSVSGKDDLIVEIAVIEKDLSAVAVGTRAVLHINRENISELVEGTVATISSILNPQTRTANIEIVIPPGYEYLLPNTSVSVSLVTDEKENIIVVPVEALVERLGETTVYVYNEGLALEREVEVGLNNGMKAEIIEGIHVGDHVITSTPMNLKNGDKVFVYKGVEGN